MTESTRALDEDLPEGDSLLGVPVREFFRVRSLRGLALLAVALVILLWPDRTDRALGVLVGIAGLIYAISLSIDLIRDVSRRQFWSFITVSVVTGFAAALVLHPSEALRSSAQVGGVVLLGLAANEVLRMVRARGLSAWAVTKIVGLGLAGSLLIAFPTALLAAATSILAGVLAAAGLIAVFTPDDPDVDEVDRAPSRTNPATLLVDWIRRRPSEAEDRDQLQEKLFFEGPTSAVRYARFAALMAFASVIASVGVVVESTAVVIGAMLIAPLMVPLMGTAYATTMGWPRRMARGAAIALSGMVLAIVTGALVGAVAPRTVDVTANAEVLARISPTSVDLAIAVAAGAAGAYAMARRDVSDSLPGVAVAIALVPPLAVVGLCWEQLAWSEGNGALLLFLTNAAAILIAGGATFLLVGAAPIDRVSESQERVATGIVGLLTFGTIIVVLLLLNGSELAQSELARADVDQVLAEWTSEHEDYRVVERRGLSDGTLVVELVGPGEPPELDELAADLERAANPGQQIRLSWTPQEQIVVGGD